MKLKDVISESVIISDSTISQRFEDRKHAILHNYKIYNKFKKIIFVLNVNSYANQEHRDNYNGDWQVDEGLIVKYCKFFKELFGDKAIILIDPVNRGWQFGTMDIAKMGYDYIKLNIPEAKWIIRAGIDDCLLYNELLELKLDDGDFFGIPFIWPNAIDIMIKNYHNKGLLEGHYISSRFPLNITPIMFQTSQYIFKNHSFDYLYYSINIFREWVKNWLLYKKSDEDLIERVLGVQTEYILGMAIVRNKVNAKYIFDIDQFTLLLNTLVSITENKQHYDLAFKNVYFKNIGLVHYHGEQLHYRKPIVIDFKNHSIKYNELFPGVKKLDSNSSKEKFI